MAASRSQSPPNAESTKDGVTRSDLSAGKADPRGQSTRLSDEEYWPGLASASFNRIAIEAHGITMQSGMVDHVGAAHLVLPSERAHLILPLDEAGAWVVYLAAAAVHLVKY